MSDNTAALQVRLSYTGPDDESVTAPHLSVSAPYAPGALAVGGVDVPDHTESETSFELPFGAVASPTLMVIENRLGQEVLLRLGGDSGLGTLVAGQGTAVVPVADGERLSHEVVDDNGGTPGAINLQRGMGDDVIINSYDGAGINTLDVSTIRVYNNAPPSFPGGAVLVLALPESTYQPITNATITITDEQHPAGSFVTKVFGDPQD
jgi:hypothetical protein